MDTTRPAWMPAQVTVESNKPFHIIMEGQATNGGFAVDDIIFTPGSCPSKCFFFKINKYNNKGSNHRSVLYYDLTVICVFIRNSSFKSSSIDVAYT